MQSKDEHSESAACGSVGVPRVIRFAYKDFMEADGKWIAVCRMCKKTLTDRIGVSSSFTKCVYFQ